MLLIEILFNILLLETITRAIKKIMVHFYQQRIFIHILDCLLGLVLLPSSQALHQTTGQQLPQPIQTISLAIY